MQIIPVIDIRSGVVMRARAGARDSYRPIASPLAATSAPVDVVAGFLTLHPFERIYIADLDAIEGSGDNSREIGALTERFPSLRFMVDAGAASCDWRGAARIDCVIGSESLHDSAFLQAAQHDPNIVLSLDFRDEVFLGPDALHECTKQWPRQVIVMTLTRVGVGAGPDVARVSQIIERAGDRRVFAAGGVRDADDLERLQAIGAAGALVATALHDGALTRADLDRFASEHKKREP
ncbi:HisA/HisF-related TIM barrel protein [Methylocystis sp. SC2]|uniref:HisA/HisF-related TIM barrel protein n=1 Tax=Methylocystis sp. (strain SC2) TaxID=187303 RepID=UPI00027AE9F6|nr:HisA/HisF-related TIM barrel protein [Methylocystis sp. SC2]CCJ06809.1 Histidine biosynthesis protein [Methylocystis sp. SC2]